MSVLVGGGSQVNNFELISSDDHLMSVQGHRSHVCCRGYVPFLGEREGEGGTLYNEVQRIIGNGHMGPPTFPVNRQTSDGNYVLFERKFTYIIKILKTNSFWP